MMARMFENIYVSFFDAIDKLNDIEIMDIEINSDLFAIICCYIAFHLASKLPLWDRISRWITNAWNATS